MGLRDQKRMKGGEKTAVTDKSGSPGATPKLLRKKKKSGGGLKKPVWQGGKTAPESALVDGR